MQATYDGRLRERSFEITQCTDVAVTQSEPRAEVSASVFQLLKRNEWEAKTIQAEPVPTLPSLLYGVPAQRCP